ncbi:uncharacterized protein LOC135701850 [Ochlerotatus camptorhynchus]|uniref:uncharacterized protein LOC135701850 n=1 Tax=Ochlerotatus camptorhynchus TaxID=644619 RepID=UPI0031D65474
MTFCSNCYKQISSDGNPLVPSPEPFYSRMAEDREMSRFLYRLTQEIVTSRDYSDVNISRICRKFYQRSTYPDKARLARTINDLKHKLEIQHNDSENGSLDAFNDGKDCHCSCNKKPKRHLQMGKANPLDKSISAQSFGKLPGMLVNSATRMHGTTNTQTIIEDANDPLKRCLDKKDSNSTDSISTITSYNFSSSLYPPFNESPIFNVQHSLDDVRTLVEEQILPKLGGDPKEDLNDGCCEQNKNSTQSNSVDMVMRVAASDRVFAGQGERKCPLHRCEEFGHSSTCGMGDDGVSGGCGKGCASDFTLPKTKAKAKGTETPPTTCCGKRKKPKTAKKANGRKMKNIQ